MTTDNPPNECYLYQPKNGITIVEIANIIPFLIMGYDETKREVPTGWDMKPFFKKGIKISKELFVSLPEGLDKHFSKFEP